MGVIVYPDATHYCEELTETRYCDRLSGTGNTCYPTPGTTVGKKFCATGWAVIFDDSLDPGDRRGYSGADTITCHPIFSEKGCE